MKAALRVAIADDEVTRYSEQQGEGHVSGRAVEDAGHIADGNAALPRRLQPNVVDADAEIADYPEAGHALSCSRHPSDVATPRAGRQSSRSASLGVRPF